MAISLLTSLDFQNSAPSDGGPSSSIDTTGADLLLMTLTHSAAGQTPVVSDNKSNSWTEIALRNLEGFWTSFYYSKPTSVGSGHTFSAIGDSSYSSFHVAAFRGVAASPADQYNTNYAEPVTSIQPGSITPTESSELLIAALSNNNGSVSSLTINNSFSIYQSHAWDAVDTIGLHSAYLIQGSASAINPTFSWTGNTQAIAIILSIKAAIVSHKRLLLGVGI